MIGLSAGGFGATVLGLHHLGRFSVVESWSGYFHPTDPSGTLALDRGPLTSVHNLISVLKADERRRATFFAFYVGDGDARFLAENLQLDRELDAAHVKHSSRSTAGATRRSSGRRMHASGSGSRSLISRTPRNCA